MAKIFQRFDLDVEKLRRIMSEGTPSFDDIVTGGRTLKSELISKGYNVLESSVVIAGLSDSIIVGGEFGMQHKQDFYEVAGRFNLPYNSGDCYFPHPESHPEFMQI